MHFPSIFFGAVLAVVAIGCGGPRSNAVDLVQDIGVSEIRADLQTLVASPAGRQHEIPPTAWPESIRRLQPVSVHLHMTGVLMVFSRTEREQHGLLFMLNSADDPGAGGSGVVYENLGDGLFWCTEKLRSAYLPPGQRRNR
ncbi:MAG TPA: hypothetical protein DCY13_15865 [Verrucomicrobiales bacterium]|nr:hypothetical protein [Verrucomicrobiales bacterium]